jgi:demethylmenaquinone methyltransferase/2-methoxy-6-polyprenyl-1,4-benzoquinol methylase
MSLAHNVTQYYAELAPIYDHTAGYKDSVAERLRIPIKARYRDIFRARSVLEIACGTGYWTLPIAEVAKSVLAVDINPALLSQAEERCAHLSNVTFQVADAYTLAGIPTGFNAAFGIWWWSHVPRERIAAFLAALHGKLEPGAFVLFVDQLPYDGPARRKDAGGNTLEQRSLPDGRLFEIVKNFPTEEDIRSSLARIAENVEYIKRSDERSWTVTYTKR